MCLSTQAQSAYKRKKYERFYQCFQFTKYFPNCLFGPELYASQSVSQKHIHHYTGKYSQLPHRRLQSSIYGILDIFFIQPIHTSILLVHTKEKNMSVFINVFSLQNIFLIACLALNCARRSQCYKSITLHGCLSPCYRAH